VYKITIESTFNACHCVKLPTGKWEKPHNHQWLARASIAAENLDHHHMVMDFVVAKDVLDRILACLSDRKLNDLPQFDGQIPTAESVAKHIFDQLSAKLAEMRVKVAAVEVQEAPGMWATYRTDRIHQ